MTEPKQSKNANEVLCQKLLTESFGEGQEEGNRIVWNINGYHISLCSGCGFVTGTKDSDTTLLRFWSTLFYNELSSLIEKVKIK